ncbi:S1 family peptidase [Corynebacterium diphtheriae]|uniref:S1 family peptidase n=1 Tax=Corynebacterium diphtheriae TaxID=1717 RepID=UPI000EF23C8D|nr:S1 family peptidase [Corynebacterium diphtheriae]MBG9335950.1 S1 family peptidase [Corynebacterium diphtheriae bv. gravis]RLP15286.1 S1 family peptidase [Corynebacterium diphtheriae]CAB0927765.1 S1 family peptidase [Corynebacterium diphtheriae]
MKKLRTLAVTLTAITASTMATMPAQAVISPTPSHQGSLAYVSFDNMQCTGTLVSPTTVLTARHCLNGGLGRVRLGADHFTAVRAVAHPQADLAVLHLDRPAPIAPSTISGRHAQPGNRFGVAGYGSAFTGVPMAAAATMQRRVTDVPSPDRQAVMIENHISQGVLCPGDSGGPLLEGNHVVGVLSMSSASGRVGWYIPTAEHADWIAAAAGIPAPGSVDKPAPLVDATAFPTQEPSLASLSS